MRKAYKFSWDEGCVEFWELMGYFHGDGSLRKNSAEFYAGSDDEYAWLEPKMQRVFSGVVKTYRTFSPVNGSNFYLLSVPRQVFELWLRSQGFVNGKERVFIKGFWSLSSEFKRAFIRGYYEADGCVSFSWHTTKKNYHNITVAVAGRALKMISTVGAFLESEGVKCSVCQAGPKRHLQTQARILRHAIPKFREVIGFISDKKRAKLDEACNLVKNEV